MGLWAWYKRRWFEKLDADKKRREQAPLRQAFQIETNRLRLFEFETDELAVETLAGWIAVAWPTNQPVDDMYSFLRDQVFAPAPSMKDLGEADAPHGSALRFVNALLLVTNRRVAVRLLGEGRVGRGGIYDTYSYSPLKETRDIPLTSIRRVRIDPVETFQVRYPSVRIRSVAEGDALQVSASVLIETRDPVPGPRWPTIDVGNGAAQFWIGGRIGDTASSGIAFGATPLTLLPYGLSLPNFGAALAAVGLPVTGPIWQATLEAGLADEWLPIRERLDLMREELER